MSIPAGRPLDPIDLSAYASQKARERAAAQQHASESDDPSIASPYAPKRARGSTTATPHSIEDDCDLHSPAQIPDEARAGPVEESKAAAGNEAHPLPRFLVAGGSRGQPEQARRAEPVESPPVVAEVPETDPADSRESQDTADPDWLSAAAASDSSEAPFDLDVGPALQPDDAAERRLYDEPPPKHADTSESDRDLERLEASLHWLQRAGSTARLPRAASLAPAPGLHAADGTRRRYSADLIARGARPRSLEPERMAPPPASSRGDKLRLALYMFIPSMFVGAISYYLAVGGWTPQPQPAARPQAVSHEPMIARQDSPPVVDQEQSPVPARDDRGDVQASASDEKSRPPAEILPAEKSTALPAESPPERQVLAMPQPAETAPQPAPTPVPATPARKLDPEEISILLKRGDHFIATGDLVTARTVFRRAAEAGDATAAIALGATYDPGVLASLGVVGMGAADVEKARHWYQKAESLGSSEASRRLQMLAAR
jgi:hypothetical protein